MILKTCFGKTLPPSYTVCANHYMFINCSIFVFLILELSIQRANKFYRLFSLVWVTISHNVGARTSGRSGMNYGKYWVGHC